MIVQLAQVPSGQDYLRFAGPEIDKSKLALPSPSATASGEHHYLKFNKQGGTNTGEYEGQSRFQLPRSGGISGEMTSLSQLLKEQSHGASGEGFGGTHYQPFLNKTQSSPFASALFKSPTARASPNLQPNLTVIHQTPSILSTAKNSDGFFYNPATMRKDFSSMHTKSSSRQIILQSKIGANYLKNKKLSLSGKMPNSPLNAFMLGQMKVGMDVNNLVQLAQNKPIIKTVQLSPQTTKPLLQIKEFELVNEGSVDSDFSSLSAMEAANMYI